MGSTPFPASSALALASLSLALLACTASAETDTMIGGVLAELAPNVQADIRTIMGELNMTDDDTYFRRFVSHVDGEVVNQSLALIKYPTVDNDFFIDFIKLASNLDQDTDHVLLVCGHGRPDACLKTSVHENMDPAHPCGPSDAVDPVQANRTGSFCEIINMTTVDENGQALMYGAERIEYLKKVHDEDVAAGMAPQHPVIQLEVIKADELMEILNMSTVEELAHVADYDESQASTVDLDFDPDTAAAAPDPSPESRRHNRRLLRIGGFGGGGFHGGIRGGGLGRMGMRGGMGAGGLRFGAGRLAGRGRGGLSGVNQVLAAGYYGRGAGRGQRTYFNDPGFGGR